MSKYLILGKPFKGTPEYNGIEYSVDVPESLLVQSGGGVSAIYHHWSHGLYSGFNETHGINGFNLPKYVYGEYGNLYDVGDNANVMMGLETNPNKYVDRSGGLVTGKPGTKIVTPDYVDNKIKNNKEHEIPDTSFWNNRTFVPSGRAPTVQNRGPGDTPSGISTKRYDQTYIPTHVQISNQISNWDEPAYDPKQWAALSAPVNFKKVNGLKRIERYVKLDDNVQLVSDDVSPPDTKLNLSDSIPIKTGYKMNALLIFVIILVFSLAVQLWLDGIQQFVSDKFYRGRPLSLKSKFIYAFIISCVLIALLWFFGIPVGEINEL